MTTLQALLEQWEARSKDALPTDAMLINKHIRELRTALAQQGEPVAWRWKDTNTFTASSAGTARIKIARFTAEGIEMTNEELQQWIDSVPTRAQGAFEQAAYSHYLAQHATGVLADSQEAPMSPENLFWKQPDGSYGVLMFNAAWWGWSSKPT